MWSDDNTIAEMLEDARRDDEKETKPPGIFDNDDMNAPPPLFKDGDTNFPATLPDLNLLVKSGHRAFDSESAGPSSTAPDLGAEIHSVGALPAAPDVNLGHAGVLTQPATTTQDTKSGRICQICKKNQPYSNFLQHAPTSACTHPAIVCSPCLASSVAKQMKEKAWYQIDCPVCDTRMGFDDVKTFGIYSTDLEK